MRFTKDVISFGAQVSHMFLFMCSVFLLSHVYAIADAAFGQSQASTQEQCIIIRYHKEGFV